MVLRALMPAEPQKKVFHRGLDSASDSTAIRWEYTNSACVFVCVLWVNRPRNWILCAMAQVGLFTCVACLQGYWWKSLSPGWRRFVTIYVWRPCSMVQKNGLEGVMPAFIALSRSSQFGPFFCCCGERNACTGRHGARTEGKTNISLIVNVRYSWPCYVIYW